MSGEDEFERVSFHCLRCRRPGLLRRAVWLSLTRLGLEGECPACGARSVHVVDLLEADARLREEVR